ncbi:hypothetical protein CHS0354_026783 [Potamilus streckersoni]|uniref:Uncharacterized protein n=1 Tax=Potamilus streckersoni TaxID=2493646 RepID=A0AAE0T543_9BIVA|nr:hypothetical protein CHS0354_026783 [Potamilus streckersoni]
MMKKIIKSAFLLAVAGAVTVPAFAQEYSSSVSGAVRAEWNMDTISGPKMEQLGNMQYLNNHFKGGANAFATSFANGTDVGRNNDVEFESFYGGYKNADLGLDVGVLVSQTSGTGMILPNVTYAPTAADDVTNDDGDSAGSPAVEDFQSTLYGLVVNLKMPDVVGLDVTFEFAQGETKGVKDRDISADGLKGKGTYMALGVGVTPVEGLSVV